MTDQTSPPELRITRRFDAPIARVWEAWTKPEAFAVWLGPKGSTTQLLDADIRTGGHLRTRMEAPHGVMLTAFFYRDVTAPHRIVWEHCFVDEAGALVRPGFFPVWPLKLLTTVDLAEEAGGTRVTLRWQPLDATPEEERAFAEQMSGMDAGWANSFDQLAAWLAG